MERTVLFQSDMSGMSWYKIEQRAVDIFFIADKNIAQLSEMDISDLLKWMKNLPEKLSSQQLRIGSEIIKEIVSRLSFYLM